jgi:septum formation protein
MVKDIAYKKGFCVACMYPDALILAADTIVVLNGKVFGKPKNKQESETMIRLLNGSRHSVYTGVAIIQGDKKSVFYDVVHIKMKKIPEYELKQLFGKHTDKAGSYAIQDHDDNFVDKIYGDRYTAVGLPYTKLVKELERFWN